MTTTERLVKKLKAHLDLLLRERDQARNETREWQLLCAEYKARAEAAARDLAALERKILHGCTDHDCALCAGKKAGTP